MNTYPTREMKELFEAVAELKNEKEISDFFRDLLTLPEITEFANRWQIVKLLVQKKPYLQIANTLNVSTTTVTRVAQWLNNGMGGYKTVAERMFKTK